jgi:hypothetical protein
VVLVFLTLWRSRLGTRFWRLFCIQLYADLSLVITSQPPQASGISSIAHLNGSHEASQGTEQLEFPHPTNICTCGVGACLEVCIACSEGKDACSDGGSDRGFDGRFDGKDACFLGSAACVVAVLEWILVWPISARAYSLHESASFPHFDYRII